MAQIAHFPVNSPVTNGIEVSPSALSLPKTACSLKGLTLRTNLIGTDSEAPLKANQARTDFLRHRALGRFTLLARPAASKA